MVYENCWHFNECRIRKLVIDSYACKLLFSSCFTTHSSAYSKENERCGTSQQVSTVQFIFLFVKMGLRGDHMLLRLPEKVVSLFFFTVKGHCLLFWLDCFKSSVTLFLNYTYIEWITRYETWIKTNVSNQEAVQCSICRIAEESWTKVDIFIKFAAKSCIIWMWRVYWFASTSMCTVIVIWVHLTNLTWYDDYWSQF